MGLAMLCDVCEEPCSDGFYLISLTKGGGGLSGAVGLSGAYLNLGTAHRLTVCPRCAAGTTVEHLAQLRGVVIPVAAAPAAQGGHV